MSNSVAPEELSEEQITQANTMHKSMIQVGPNGEAFLQYILHNASNAGIKEVAFVVSATDSSIRDYYEPLSGSDQVYGLQLFFVVQKIPQARTKPAGTADAVVQALDALPDWEQSTILVCNGDNLYSTRAFATMAQITNTNGLLSYDPTALGYDDVKLTQVGNIVVEDNKLVRIVEKPDLTTLLQLRKDYTMGVSMSVFRFVMPEVSKYIRAVDYDAVLNEKLITTALENILLAGIPLYVDTIAEPLPDLTTKFDIIAVQQLLSR
jgi:glucose-1-phosphate adenylyltransferase